MQRLAYKVEGLDCGEEVLLLKRALSSAKGVEHLEFNILQSQMLVSFNDELINSAQIIALVQATGMKAIPWQEVLSSAHEPLWNRQGRLFLTVFSAIFLLAAGITRYLYPSQVLYQVLSAFSIICGAWYVFPKALYALRRLAPDMNLLMLIAVCGAVAINQWLEAASVAFLFSLSLLLEQWSVGRARRAISALLDLTPLTARVIDESTGAMSERKVGEVAVGALLLVRPGEKIPLDCIVEGGSSSVDQSPITGESLPLFKQVGDEVFAGTLNGDGALTCRVMKEAGETTLARIIQLIEQARSKRSESEQWIETFAYYYTPIMVVFALLVMILPPLLFAASWASWIYRGLVLLVIACPCALVISTPVTIICGLTAAARQGVLVKGGVFLEEIGKIKALALDKTGTLTNGHPVVQSIVPLNEHTPMQLMERAVAIEKSSGHPLARAILRKGEEMGVQVEAATNYQSIRGKGALATFQGKLYWIGSHRFMHEMGQENEEIHHKALSLEDEGHSIVAIGNDNHVCGLLSIGDSPRLGARETVMAIKSLGVQEVVMLTGDNLPTARALAALTLVDSYFAELLPEEKVAQVLLLAQSWEKVGMVGDGVNDAPAMAAATVGIAMGAMGAHAAIETADIALMSDDLSKIPWLMRHSRRTLSIIKQNIAFALCVKAIFILLAFLNEASLWMAIAADTGATLLVIFNGLRLLRRQ